jgi:hypothetical protein
MVLPSTVTPVAACVTPGCDAGAGVYGKVDAASSPAAATSSEQRRISIVTLQEFAPL